MNDVLWPKLLLASKYLILLKNNDLEHILPSNGLLAFKRIKLSNVTQ